MEINEKSINNDDILINMNAGLLQVVILGTNLKMACDGSPKNLKAKRTAQNIFNINLAGKYCIDSNKPRPYLTYNV